MRKDLRVAGFPKRLLDSMPAVVMVLDKDLRIVFRNTEAGALPRTADPSRKKLGDVLDCVNASEALGGCGRSQLCRSCAIRKWVNAAISGKSMRRGHVRRDGGTAERCLYW